MAVEWYCRLMGTEMGPYTSSQLIQMARSHQLTPQDVVKKGADGNWVDANRVKGLFDEAASSSIIMARLPPELKKSDPKQGAPDEQDDANETAVAQPRAESWYYISDQGKVGPVSFAELIAAGKRGLLKPTHRVWSSSSPKWCEAKEIKGLTFDGPAETGS